MAFDLSAKEEIKRRADIVELIGQFVQLRKAGRNYVGLCPFHGEKAPSFSVSPERQMFHCFGCKKGGDVFAFWMEYHSATFPEAVRDLAERYNVQLREQAYSLEDRRQAEMREALFQANELAATYFQKTLNDPSQGRAARTYLEMRRLSGETVREFRLGYSSAAWDGLVGFLEAKRVGMDLAVNAGLVVPRKSGGWYDRFRGRLMFPIHNLRGQVVGFGGRVLDDSLPKYLNTPESPVFHKGETLYGLNSTHASIRAAGSAVIVEGYMDLLALVSHGVREVVATLGTALTTDHIRRLKGYAAKAVVIFDADTAGRAAALRSLPHFLNEGLAAKAVLLPDGNDPDTFIKGHGSEALLRLVADAVPMFDFYLEQKMALFPSDVEGKVRVLHEALPVLSLLTNAAQRSLYVTRVAERTGIREDIVLAELRKAAGTEGIPSPAVRIRTRQDAASVPKEFHRERRLLNLLIYHPRCMERLKDCDWSIFLTDSDVLHIIQTFFRRYRPSEAFSAECLLEAVDTPSACEKLREALLVPPLDSEQTAVLAVAELEEKVRQIQLRESIRKARAAGDIKTLNDLLQRKAEGPRRSST